MRAWSNFGRATSEPVRQAAFRSGRSERWSRTALSRTSVQDTVPYFFSPSKVETALERRMVKGDLPIMPNEWETGEGLTLLQLFNRAYIRSLPGGAIDNANRGPADIRQ